MVARPSLSVLLGVCCFSLPDDSPSEDADVAEGHDGHDGARTEAVGVDCHGQPADSPSQQGRATVMTAFVCSRTLSLDLQPAAMREASDS